MRPGLLKRPPAGGVSEVSVRPLFAERFAGGTAFDPVSRAEAPPIVVIVGMHRSGTSLCSHVLSMLGVDMTEDIDAQPSNAKGQWERLELRDFNDEILALFDRGFYSLHHDLPLPPAWWADPRVATVRARIVTFLRQRMAEQRLFGFKDPRTARLLPLWQMIFDELRLAPKYVFCLRNPAQVARSLAARDGFLPEAGECRWFCYVAEALGNLAGRPFVTIEYEDWFADPAVNLQKLAKFLAIERLPAAADLQIAASHIIDPYLRHDEPGLGEARQPAVRELYETARQISENPAALQQAAGLAERFAAFRELYRPVHNAYERTAKIAAELPRREDEIANLTAALEDERARGAAALAERDAEIEALRVTAAERDRLAAECADWFDAAILGPIGRLARRRHRHGLPIGRYLIDMAPRHGKGSSRQRAQRAADERRWACAARFYVDALAQSPADPILWARLGEALREAGKPAAAEAACRHALSLGPPAALRRGIEEQLARPDG